MNGIVTFSLARIDRAPTRQLLNGISRLARLVLGIGAERRQLAALEDWQLEDIGVTRAQADAEAGRAFGDIPAHRKTGLYL